MSASIRRITIALAGLGFIGAHTAMAVCTPGQSYTRYVGDTATDAQCTDNDIQSAINQACPDTTIFITPEHTYTAQHLDINGKSLTLRGTPCSCGFCFEPANPTSPFITVSGAGHSGDSVLYIHGDSNVTLQYLTIQAGNNLGGYGGGVHFDGTGSLRLDTTWVRNNVAEYGAGINFNGSGGNASLTLLAYTQILNNSANSSGGGIRLSGNSYLSAVQDSTLIALNRAPSGYGGGINVVGPARADIGSPGLGVGVVYSNKAKYGGGIAVTSSGSDDAKVQLFTTDPTRPVRITDNSASSSGGAFYLKGNVGTLGSFTFSKAVLCAQDFRIDNNSAAEGSAIHADYDSNPTFASGSQALFNTCTGLPPSARRCATAVPCNTTNGNYATDASGNPTLGATIRVEDASIFDGDRFAMQGNHGGYAIRSSAASPGYASASNCLLTNNQLTRQLLNSGSGSLEISNCTLANNSILSTDTIHAEGYLGLFDSIIDQPGNLALAYSGNASDLHVAYVLSTDVSTLPERPDVTLGTPTYINAANGDYHLQVTSLGIDYAPFSGSDYDLDGQSRYENLLEVGNLWGSLDLGAYERQRDDTIFRNGFDAL